MLVCRMSSHTTSLKLPQGKHSFLSVVDCLPPSIYTCTHYHLQNESFQGKCSEVVKGTPRALKQGLLRQHYVIHQSSLKWLRILHTMHERITRLWLVMIRCKKTTQYKATGWKHIRHYVILKAHKLLQKLTAYYSMKITNLLTLFHNWCYSCTSQLTWLVMVNTHNGIRWAATKIKHTKKGISQSGVLKL